MYVYHVVPTLFCSMQFSAPLPFFFPFWAGNESMGCTCDSSLLPGRQWACEEAWGRWCDRLQIRKCGSSVEIFKAVCIQTGCTLGRWEQGRLVMRAWDGSVALPPHWHLREESVKTLQVTGGDLGRFLFFLQMLIQHDHVLWFILRMIFCLPGLLLFFKLTYFYCWCVRRPYGKVYSLQWHLSLWVEPRAAHDVCD